MAEQIVSSATSAVTGELAKILFSGLAGRLVDRQAAAEKKLRRLELLLIKVHSAVEASEKHPIENAWLLKWRDKLKEAAAEGDEVLAGFRQRQQSASMDAAHQGQVPGDDAHRQQEQGQPSPSSSATASGLAQGTRGATKAPRLFWTDEDMERLNSAVERLEELSPEIGMFVKLLKIEILTPEQRSRENTGSMMVAKRKRPSASIVKDGSSFKLFGCKLEAGFGGGALMMPPPSMSEEGSEESCRKTTVDHKTVEATSTTQEEEEERSTLVGRLEEAFATICKTVEFADGRDLSEHEWLAYWASILREAKWQGCAVLGAISARGGAAAGEEVARCDDHDQDSEFGRFVCGMESLAGEADYFAGLACLCGRTTSY
ncbi:unnamed protein product [Urochloa humidicola]